MAAKKSIISASFGALAVALLLLPGCGKKEEAPQAEVTEEAAVQDEAAAEATAGIDTLSFSTVTLDNEPVTQDIFSDYDLTVVTVWGTFCEPFIKEAEDYAKLYDSLPENVNMIGIVLDVNSDSDEYVEEAKKILADGNVHFKNLRMSSDLEVMLYDIQETPASFVVDSKGKIVGEVKNGADVAETKKLLGEGAQ